MTDKDFQDQLLLEADQAKRKWQDLREQAIQASWDYSDAQKRADCRYHVFIDSSEYGPKVCRLCGAKWPLDKE